MIERLRGPRIVTVVPQSTLREDGSTRLDPGMRKQYTARPHPGFLVDRGLERAGAVYRPGAMSGWSPGADCLDVPVECHAAVA
jgi:hypothetical protein